MRVWIDLANSPHPLLFAPVARRLEELGHTVSVTARDHAQTLELARERWPDVEMIGGPSPSGRRSKAVALVKRARALRSWAKATRPDVALSHNSYAQLAAARSLGIRGVTAMDYEHQPANHVAFRAANRILLPAALPLELVRRLGAAPAKVTRYDGLKEELYVGDFEPDEKILERIGIAADDGGALVVMRAPPAGAMYHRAESPILRDAVDALGRQPSVQVVLLVRDPREQTAVAAQAPANCLVPARAVDSRSLIYAADLFVGAGGTMTREAAIMGVPTVSIYSGPPPYVDLWLERRGLLRRIDDPRELAGVERRTKDPVAPEELRRRGAELVETFVRETVEDPDGPRRAE